MTQSNEHPKGNESMFYVRIGCPVCVTGVIGVLRCADGKNLVLVCDECETVWKSPELISASNALDALPPAFVVSELSVAIAGGSSGWATMGEIAEKGWTSYVKGDQSSEVNKHAPVTHEIR